VGQPIEIITDPDVDARRKARAEEYGTWECGPNPIHFDGARAFNEGEPVPKSTVERLALDKLGVVVSTGTYAEKAAAEEEERQARRDAALKEQLEATAVAPVKRPRRSATTDTTDTDDAKGGNG
jgi:hypothetical protein